MDSSSSLICSPPFFKRSTFTNCLSSQRIVYQKRIELLENIWYFILFRAAASAGGNHKPFYCNDVLSKLQLITIFHVKGEATNINYNKMALSTFVKFGVIISG